MMGALYGTEYSVFELPPHLTRNILLALFKIAQFGHNDYRWRFLNRVNGFGAIPRCLLDHITEFASNQMCLQTFYALWNFTKMFSRNQRRASLIAAFLAIICSPVLAKSQKFLTERIQIDAKPQAVFETLRKYRTCDLHHRKLVSYDGKKALIDESIDGVPVYGKVHCLWEEKEVPYQRIDYTLVNSDKFAGGSGSYVILASREDGKVTLELESSLESGLHLPFASEISQGAERKDMKARLSLIKRMAEEMKLSEVAANNI